MRKSTKFLSLLLFGVTVNSHAANNSISSSHGIDYPEGWQNWATIAVSHRTDNKTLRVILGNDIAIKAARSGKTKPWPKGTIIGKVVWKETQLNDWQAAIVPKEFVHVEFMVKDTKKYIDNGGWGWARWVGLEKKPFEKGMQECSSCHAPAKHRDWVFTEPALLPK